MTDTPAFPTTIAQLLAATAKPANLVGEGRFAYVYRFASPELAPYLLRVEKRLGIHVALANSTALTPARKLISNLAVGQPLATLDALPGVSILQKQPGAPLKTSDYGYYKSRPDRAEEEARENMDIMRTVMEMGTPGLSNPLVPIFDDAFRAAYSGYVPDIHTRNILHDKAHNALLLVDQLYDTRAKPHWNSGKVYAEKQLAYGAHCMLDDMRLYEMLPKDSAVRHEYEQAKTEFHHLVKDAQSQIIDRYRGKQHQPEKLTFADVSQVKAVALTDPPRALVQQLKQLHKATQSR